MSFPVTSAAFFPDLSWVADLSVGHDNEILADADRGVVTAVSSDSLAAVGDVYYNGSSRLLLRWDNLWKPDRLEIVAGAGGVLYGSEVGGGDSNLELSGSYRRHFSSSLVLDLAGTGFRFRRAEETSSEPVFDFDLYRVSSRLGWAVDKDWLWSTGVQQDWIDFPGRFLFADSTELEEQRQFNVSVALMRRLGGRGFVAGEMLYRWTDSNSERAEYEGPVFTMRTRASLMPRLRVSNYVSIGHRSYRSLADTVVSRKDDTWQIGAKLTRQLSSRLDLFLEGSFLHQTSNLGRPFAYDQTRFAVGVTLRFLAPGPWSPPGLQTRPAPFSPTATGRGIRFRIRAPEASSVAVVGGFNAWDPREDPLTGPDRNGVWEVSLALPPGVWRYAFVVDGRFVPPPEAPRYEEDGFGGRHGVLEVPGSQGDEGVTGVPKSRRRR